MNSIYLNKPIFDNRGDHIYWAVNGHRFGRIDYTNTTTQYFRYDYEIPFDIEFANYKDEIDGALIKIYQKYGKTLALCISGKDSEIIARQAVSLGIPCKLYFLRFWGINDNILRTTEQLAKELNVEIVPVDLSERECMEKVIFDSYDLMSTLKPTYLCLPYLFDNIPVDEFIIVGEGDLAKENKVYETFVPKFLQKGIPILSSEIVYRIWAQEKGRHGEYYFHGSTPGLVLSAYNHPLISRNHPYIYTDKMYSQYWPNLKFTEKTANFGLDPAKSQLIKEILKNLGRPVERIVGTFIPHKCVARNMNTPS